MPATNYPQEVIRRFLIPAIIKLGGVVPVQKRIESYDDYSLRCLELIATLLSGGGGGGGITPGAGTVTTATILDGAITSAKIQAGSIATGNIADAAITTDKIADGSIQTVDLADGAIATAKIVDGAITSAKILDGSIATIDLADGSVTSAKILDGTILAIDIADGVITAAKLAAGAVGTASIPDSGITTVKILDAAITAAKLATNAVNTTAIVDAAVTTGKIANDAITSGKIADGAVGTADLADGAITAAKLAATAAVLSLNALKGDLILAAGSNVAIAAAGNTLTLNASNGTSSLTAPVNPYAGQVWFNIAGSTVSGIPSGSHGVWNGAAWVNVGSAQPRGVLLTLISAPSNPLPGTTWQNISGGTLSGIPSGRVAVWNGAVWVDVIYPPSTISTAAVRVGFLVTFPTFTITDGTGTLLPSTTKVYDTFGAFSLATSIYTVPATQEGVWLWDVGCSVFNNGAFPFNIFGTVNTTTINIIDVLHSANPNFGAVGLRPLLLSANDSLRFYVNGTTGQAVNTGSLYATRVQRVG